MDNSAEDGGAQDAPPESAADTGPGAKPKGRPGRKPKGSVPTVVTEMPDRPDPGHVLTWRQRKVLQVIGNPCSAAAIHRRCVRSARRSG